MFFSGFETFCVRHTYISSHNGAEFERNTLVERSMARVGLSSCLGINWIHAGTRNASIVMGVSRQTFAAMFISERSVNYI